MKRKTIIGVLLAAILITGCGNSGEEMKEILGQSAAGSATTELSEEVRTEAEAPVSTENGAAGGSSVTDQSGEVEQSGDADTGTETVEYSYEDLYFSIDIPEGWEYELKTAEEMEKYDGLAICEISFWSAEYPDTVFELSYQTAFGICGTGVTIEDFASANGLSGYRYTEEIDDTLWLTITLNNPNNDLIGGAYVITAAPKLAVWEALEAEFEQIVNSVWVGPRTE